MRVLITSVRTPHAINIIRSFGALGWEITAADCTSLSPGLYSRFVTRRLVVPPLSENPAGFVDALCNELQRQEYDLLFPTFEDTFVVSLFRERFEQYTKVLVSDYSLFMKVHNKVSLTALCNEWGIATPPTWTLKSMNDLDSVAAQVEYPAVVKLPDVNNSLGLAFVDDAESLKKHVRKVVKFFGLTDDRLPMIQKKIEGDLIFSLFLADHGKTVGSLIYKPLKMFPDGGGTAFYRESVRNPEAEQLAQRLIEKLGWHGFIGFDYVIDPETGTPYLIDANPRVNPAYQTGECAGVPFTQMAVDIVSGKSPEPMLEPKPGVRFKTLFVEAIWFVFQFLPGKNYGRRVRDALSVFRKREFNPDVHRGDDKKPSLMMALFMHYFLFVINVYRPKTGGFMFSCNYNLGTEAKLNPKRPALENDTTKEAS